MLVEYIQELRANYLNDEKIHHFQDIIHDLKQQNTSNILEVDYYDGLKPKLYQQLSDIFSQSIANKLIEDYANNAAQNYYLTGNKVKDRLSILDSVNYRLEKLLKDKHSQQHLLEKMQTIYQANDDWNQIYDYIDLVHSKDSSNIAQDLRNLFQTQHNDSNIYEVELQIDNFSDKLDTWKEVLTSLANNSENLDTLFASDLFLFPDNFEEAEFNDVGVPLIHVLTANECGFDNIDEKCSKIIKDNLENLDKPLILKIKIDRVDYEILKALDNINSDLLIALNVHEYTIGDNIYQDNIKFDVTARQFAIKSSNVSLDDIRTNLEFWKPHDEEKYSRSAMELNSEIMDWDNCWEYIQNSKYIQKNANTWETKTIKPKFW